MKKNNLAVLILSFLFLISLNSCDYQPQSQNKTELGSLLIKFNLGGRENARAINNDFTQVNSGKVFLQQGGAIKYQAQLVVDNINKTGEATIPNMVIGTYDVILELYDSASNIIYSGTDSVAITSDSSSAISVQLSKNTASLSLSGSWIEDISDLSSALVQLKKNTTVMYAGNLILDPINKTVTGGINNIQPGSYELYVEIKNSTSMICFTGTQPIIISRGNNAVALALVVKTGSIVIDVIGDATAPGIISGPSAAVNGNNATITWITNENATTNACYSETSGFDYQTTTNWAPIGQDLTADNTNHSVIIQGLVQGRTYYYVAVSTDVEGNTIVSDEFSFTVSAIPRNGLIGEWLFNGNAIDTSGNGNNGTVYEVNPAADRFGNINNAFAFNGSSSYIKIANTIGLLQSYTISAWIINTKTYGAITCGRIFSNGGWGNCNGSVDFGIGVQTDNSFKLFIINQTGSNQGMYETINSNLPNVWTHVAVTYNATDLTTKLFINGVNISGNISSGSGFTYMPNPNQNPIYNYYIGRMGSEYWDYFQGLIDDVRVYNRELSESEVLSLYQ